MSLGRRAAQHIEAIGTSEHDSSLRYPLILVKWCCTGKVLPMPQTGTAEERLHRGIVVIDA
eukprot:1161758-Pelagomonas_calceolata.AAC.3